MSQWLTPITGIWFILKYLFVTLFWHQKLWEESYKANWRHMA